jgi:hypothetical protein
VTGSIPNRGPLTRVQGETGVRRASYGIFRMDRDLLHRGTIGSNHAREMDEEIEQHTILISGAVRSDTDPSPSGSPPRSGTPLE